MSVSKFLNLFGRKPPSPRRPVPGRLQPIDPIAQRESRSPGAAQLDWERTLSAAAQEWLHNFPPAVKPERLAEAFPRIANRLALCWRDTSLVDKVMDDLLVDKRGGRTGFPPTVSAELLRLQAFHERRSRSAVRDEGSTPGKAWDRHLQASADR